jgi:diguanylate cyclase
MADAAAPRSILVVDDERDALETLRLLLEGEGFEVRTASSGAEALQLMRERKPDLVILDVMMPAMTGYDVCRHLRRDPTTSDVPCIAYSGYQVGHPNADLYDLVLLKPVEFDQLLHAIRSLLPSQPPKGGKVPAHAYWLAAHCADHFTFGASGVERLLVALV